MTTEPPADASVARRPRLPGLVNNAVYVAGKRVESPASLQGTFKALDKHPDALAWIGLYRPAREMLDQLADEFDLHELAIEDAVNAHQRPKLERYGDTLFMVLRAAHYDDAHERVHFGELHVFAGANFIITVRHSESPDLALVRAAHGIHRRRDGRGRRGDALRDPGCGGRRVQAGRRGHRQRHRRDRDAGVRR